MEALGVENLGIYNVVGGIIALMGFFQAAQTKSTSRFITYEIGKGGDSKSLKRVFSVCMTIHILMVVAAVFIAETVGFWIVANWTNIPQDRFNAAMFVYQFSVLIFCIQLVRIPYDSVIVANEDMSMYAYLSILEAVLQLCIVFIVKNTGYDPLITYSSLMSMSSFVLYSSYYLWVKYRYKIYKFRFMWDKVLSRKILSFSSWTLLGTGANTATQQGVNLLMNNFVGLVANAALGFSSQINIAVSKFVNGFSTAFTPQIIKLYAKRDIESLHKLMARSSKFSFALCYIMALPIIVNMDFILHIWLGDNVPLYTADFCRLILVCTIFDATTGVYNTTVTATGKIRNYQIAISLSFILDLVCCSVLLMCDVNPVLVFSSRILTRGVINMIIGLYYVREYTGFNISAYCGSVLKNIGCTLLLTVIPVYYVSTITTGWGRLVLTTTLSVALVLFCVYTLIMTQVERQAVLKKMKLKIR